MHSGIYSGQVRHVRRGPVLHRFRYRIFMMYLDLDELPDVFRNRWLWSASRPALARFNRDNYLGDPDKPLADCVRDLVQERTGARPSGPVRMLTHLSYFGYCFNPITLNYCFDDSGNYIESVVADVSNTPWGERCCYVLSDQNSQLTTAPRRYRCTKNLHVSPFMHMDIDYDWLIDHPGRDIVVRINSNASGTLIFNATLTLAREEISGVSLAKTLITYPLMTVKVILGIHWQAFKLWLKRYPVFTHPGGRPALTGER